MSEESTLGEFTDTESSGSRVKTPIGELPADWNVEWLKDVTKINPDGFSEDDWPSKTFEYISLSEVSEGEIIKSETTPLDEAPSRAQRRIQKDDVLVGTVRPKQVSHGFVTSEHDGKICSSGFGVLRAEANLNPYYLIQEVLSQPFFSQMEAYVAGSGYPAIKISDLKKHRVSVPPLSEQRKIATVLYNVDQAIQKTEEIVEQYERIIHALQQTLIKDGLNPEESGQSTPTGRYPSSWPVVRAGEYIKLRNGEFLSKDDRGESGQYPVYGGNGIMGYTDETTVVEDTLVIGRVGAYCGNIHITESNAWVTDNAIVVNKLSDEYSPRFLAHLLDEIGLGQFSEQSAQPRISQSTVENLRIPKPPIEQQLDIVEKLDSVEKGKKTEKQYQSRLKRLKQGLMQDLLSGTIRTTDTNIEVPDKIAQHG